MAVPTITDPKTLAELNDFLEEQTGIPFRLWAWSHAPAGNYGVVTEDEDATFFAGGNAERAVQGYVDVFCRSTGFTEKASVELALQKTRFHWRHNSAQFEPETGIVHHAFSVAWLG